MQTVQCSRRIHRKEHLLTQSITFLHFMSTKYKQGNPGTGIYDSHIYITIWIIK